MSDLSHKMNDSNCAFQRALFYSFFFQGGGEIQPSSRHVIMDISFTKSDNASQISDILVRAFQSLDFALMP